MKIKKYIMASIVVAALLLAPALASAGYSDSISDSTGDVYYLRWDGTSYSWRENVERPDIDIVRASIEESGGDIHVELEVEGTIQNDTEIWYHISLRDENDDSYDLYSGYTYTSTSGTVFLDAPTVGETLDASGFGTNTLQTSFSLEMVDNPESLRITSVETHDWVDQEESGEYYYDTAGPEADDPVNGNDNDNDETNGDFDFDFDEGLIDDLIARGMLCIALAIILPIIIIIILIVVVLKVLSKDDKGGEQPPQQQYQQPPPPSGPSQQQDKSYGETPPPPPQ